MSRRYPPVSPMGMWRMPGAPPAHTADAMSDDQYLDTMFADFRHGF